MYSVSWISSFKNEFAACTGMGFVLSKLIDIVAEPSNNFRIFSSSSTCTWSYNFFDCRVIRKTVAPWLWWVVPRGWQAVGGGEGGDNCLSQLSVELWWLY